MLTILELTLPTSKGVDNTLGQSGSLQSFFSLNLWNSEPLGFNSRCRQRGCTTANIDILVFDVCFTPCLRISLSITSTNMFLRQAIRTFLAYLINNFFSGAQGGWWWIAISVTAAPTIDSVSTPDEHIFKKGHTFLRYCMEKQGLAISWWRYIFYSSTF